MRSKFLIIALGSSLAACNTPDLPTKGLDAVNVPVVTTAEYVFDASAPGGVLAQNEAQRLDGWLAGLNLGYGDTVYVDAPFSESARAQVGAIVGQYGLLVTPGAPVTAGAVPQESVRVIVARRSARVPGCPNWDVASEPNYDNAQMSGFGCGVNQNLAMQVADPVDLVQGRAGDSAVDAETATKAIGLYRGWPLTAVQEGQQKRKLKRVEELTRGEK